MTSDLLTTLAFLGTPVGINLIIGWLMVNWKGFVDLDQNIQKLIKVVIAIVLAFGSYALLQYVPGSVFDQLQPYWKILYATLTGVFGQEFGVLIVQWRQASKIRFALDVADKLRALGVASDISPKLVMNYVTVRKASGGSFLPGAAPTPEAILEALNQRPTVKPPEGSKA